MRVYGLSELAAEAKKKYVTVKQWHRRGQLVASAYPSCGPVWVEDDIDLALEEIRILAAAHGAADYEEGTA